MRYQIRQLLMIIIFWLTPIHGVSYENVTQIFEDKLDSSSGYNTAVRPLLNQSKAITVSVTFDIITIVEVDDIKQKFIINGFVTLVWTDEILAWNPADYHQTYHIELFPKHIWLPRLIVGNTLADRDMFGDDYSPLVASYNGTISWFPGSLFPTSCKLHLLKYPFDEQTCVIFLFSMGLSNLTLTFQCTTTVVGLDAYIESGEWDLLNTSMQCGVSYIMSSIEVTFFLKRRPGFFIISIVIPIVLLSFLNIMVFLIPVESGEKISYSITVLLALSVFMSIVSGMLPRSADVIPLVTIYLMVLLLISVFSVIMTIIIISIHHQDEKETRRLRAFYRIKGIFNKVKILNTTIRHVKRTVPEKNPKTHVEGVDEASTTRKHTMIDVVRNLRNVKKTAPLPREKEECKHEKDHANKWRIISLHIDFVSFIVFMTVWVSVTVGFLVEISS